MAPGSSTNAWQYFSVNGHCPLFSGFCGYELGELLDVLDSILYTNNWSSKELPSKMYTLDLMQRPYWWL